MDASLLRRVLQGDEDAAMQFGQCEHCAVVDWKDGLDAIVESVSDHLPPGFLRVKESEGSGPSLVRGDGMTFLAPAGHVKQEQLLGLVNKALAPQFEMRRFRPMDGDGYSLLVASAEFWANLGNAHPEATERYFLSVDRLAAYWSKGFFARLVSKP